MQNFPNSAGVRALSWAREGSLILCAAVVLKEAAHLISKVETRIFPRSTSVKARVAKGHQSASSSAVSGLGLLSPSPRDLGLGLQIRFSPLLRQRAPVYCRCLDPIVCQSSGQNSDISWDFCFEESSLIWSWQSLGVSIKPFKDSIESAWRHLPPLLL